MRLSAWSILVIGFVSACSTSHDPVPPHDAATADAAIVLDGGAPPEDAATIADAFVAADASADAPPEVDGGSWEGDPTCAPDGGAPMRFRNVYASVIAANGCSNDCHNGESSWTSDLHMTSAELAYRSLVNVAGCGPYLRVDPCRPEQSTLSLVPTYREEPCGGRHTFAGGGVSEEQSAMIDEWIRQGAAW